MPRDSKWNSGPVGQFHFRHFGAIADRIEDLFNAHDEAISPSSELAELFEGARALSAVADVKGDIPISQLQYYHAQSFARLAKSLIYLDYRPQFRPIFRDLKTGSINFWNSKQSKAKDTEWELLLWSHLNRIFPNSARLDEPDITLTLGHRKIGIACKRVYNFKRVYDQIREGARQLKSHNLSGIVALSFDPYAGQQDGYCLMRAPSMAEVSAKTYAYFGNVWKAIQREAIRKYLATNKVFGLIISVQGFIQIGDPPTEIAEMGAIRLQTYQGTLPADQELMDILHRAGTENANPIESEILARLEHLNSLARAIGRK